MKEGHESWELQWGARTRAEDVRFRVWAPRAHRLAVKVLGHEGGIFPLERAEDDLFETTLTGARAGADYFYVIDEERERPDPVSRWQPFGVHGPSRVLDPQGFSWSDDSWRGRALEDYLIYELHTATFTRAGTFEAVIEKLDYLRELGVTAVELMPVAEFPGARNWGYDGVHLYAPQSTYGGPTGLKQLVDACHRAGLAVILDVVYNHLGPEGNYLADYAQYFNASHQTPWGDAINFDGPESDGVRRFFIANALYWLTEYHVDALRLDAVHRIYDMSPRHILSEMAEEFHECARRLDRAAYLIAESDLNDVRVIRPESLCGYGLDAQWSDDFHHALHGLMTGSRRGYFVDFGRVADLGKAITEGFVNDGRASLYRRKRHGTSAVERPGRQFVVFTQNHDQIANSYWGERLSALVSPGEQMLAATVLLCAPNVPMLFMGQEYGELAPFYYFTSHTDQSLIEAVRDGRRAEYAAYAVGRKYADPQSPATFEACRLRWSLLDEPTHAGLLRFYRDLIALRKRCAALSNCDKGRVSLEYDEEAGWMIIKRSDYGEASALVFCNFSKLSQEVPLRPVEEVWRLALWSGDSQYLFEDSGPAPASRLDGEAHVHLAGRSAAIYLQVAATHAERPASQDKSLKP